MTDQQHSLRDLRMALFDPRIPEDAPIFVRLIDRDSRSRTGSFAAMEFPIVSGVAAFPEGRAVILAEAKPGDFARIAGDGAVEERLQQLVAFLRSIEGDGTAPESYREGARDALRAVDVLADVLSESIRLLRRSIIEEPEPPAAPPPPELPFGRCEECSRAISAVENDWLSADIDFIEHHGHLIRRVPRSSQ